MRGTFLLFAFLAIFASGAWSALTPGLYSFKSTVTEGISSKPFLQFTSKFLLTSQGSESILKIVELSLKSNDVPATVDKAFDLPVKFIRSDDGLIEKIFFHPDESVETRNLKKFMVESFQASVGHKPHTVEETGLNGVRKVRYTVSFADSKRIMVRGTYSLQDFSSFPKLSNMEKSITGLSGKKFTTFNAQDNSVISSKVVSEIVSIKDNKDMKFITETFMELESSDIEVIQMIEEVNWKPDTLLHEVDPQARISTLKSQMPSVSSLLHAAFLQDSKTLKASSQLVWLMNHDEDALNQGLEVLSKNTASALLNAQVRAFSILARLSSPKAQAILANEIRQSENDLPKLKTILRSLASLNEPASPSTLLLALQKLQVSSSDVQDLVDLTIGQVTKFVSSQEASQILVAYINRLSAAKEENEKIHLLYILGNAGQNAPLNVILPYLKDSSPALRAVALTNLRNHLQLPEVQESVMSLLSNPENHTKDILNSFVGALKQNSRKFDALNGKFGSFLASLFNSKIPKSDAMAALQKTLESRGFAPSQTFSAPLQSSSEVWNDTSDPLFNLVAPASQRDQDVLRYPENSAYIFGSQFGPRFVNLKVAGGVFSGTGGKGCLAGNFKIFDKLYTDTEILGETNVLADLQLYILTFGGNFDSRIYAIINGNTLIDFSLSNQCSEQEIPIYDGEIDIVNYETEFPVGPANGVAFIQVSAGLVFAAGYKICILTLNPYVELYLTGEVNLSADAGVTITALGIVRGGLEANVYLNYLIGPDTQLGSRNSSSGEFVCQACIGVYYGYQDQLAYTGLWYQRREGLSWGPREQIPLLEYTYPAVPFPTPLVETCSETSIVSAEKPKFLKA